MEEKQRTVLVWWMVVMICLLFLRFGVQMYEARKWDKVIEKWSERASEASERSERARQEFREKWGEEPTF